jgi:hypothetical protein
MVGWGPGAVSRVCGIAAAATNGETYDAFKAAGTAERNEAMSVFYPDKAAKAGRNIRDFGKRGHPQRLVRRGVTDDVEKLVRWLDHPDKAQPSCAQKKPQQGQQ